jgi:hypothetical protein
LAAVIHSSHNSCSGRENVVRKVNLDLNYYRLANSLTGRLTDPVIHTQPPRDNSRNQLNVDTENLRRRSPENIKDKREMQKGKMDVDLTYCCLTDPQI